MLSNVMQTSNKKKPTITKRKVYNKCTWNTQREDQHFGGNFITTVYTRKKLCRISTIQKNMSHKTYDWVLNGVQKIDMIATILFLNFIVF